MTAPGVTACVLALAIFLPASCKGQYYWGANGWRQYWQPPNLGVCERAYPARQTGGNVHSCRYLCTGLPVRYSFEQDGTPCYTDRWITGACYAGRCRAGWWPVQPPAVPQAPPTAAPAATTERASLESQGWSWPGEDEDSQRCTRADPQVPTVRRSCRYLCKGWPIRREDEADGTACQLSWWREGFCFRGHCQRNYPLPVIPSDENNQIEGGQDPVRSLKCRNYKGRVKVDGVVRSCKFVCKQRKKAFVAYEENGRPCAALPGQNGFCDHGVCKVVGTTAAPAEASETPTKHKAEETAAVVSSVTDAAPVAAAVTVEEIPAAGTQEASTVASSAGQELPEKAAPAFKTPWTPGFVGVQCERAYAPKVVDGRLVKCRFLCRGYPLLRIGFEEDGSPCLKKKTLEGICFNGICKPLPPATDATTLKDETTTVQSDVTEQVTVVTSEVGQTATHVSASADDTKSVSTLPTASEGEVSDVTSANGNGTPTAADGDETSVISESNRKAAGGDVSDATLASTSDASTTGDVQETSFGTDGSRSATEGGVSGATSASQSEESVTAAVQETSAATESRETEFQGKSSDATTASQREASELVDAKKTSAVTDSSKTETEGEIGDATLASESQTSATSELPGTSDFTDSEDNQRTSTDALPKAGGEESQDTGVTESASAEERKDSSTVHSNSPAFEQVTAAEEDTGASEHEGTTAAGEATAAVKTDDHEKLDESSETSLHPTEPPYQAEEVSIKAATIQDEDLESGTKIPSYTEADMTAGATVNKDEREVTSTASEDPEVHSEGAAQLVVEESTQEPLKSESETQRVSSPTTEAAASHGEQADQVSSDGEGVSTTLQSSSDATDAQGATTVGPSRDASLNTEGSVSESTQAPGASVVPNTNPSATTSASAGESISVPKDAEVIAERTDEAVVLTTLQDLTTNDAQGATDARSSVTEAANDVIPTESATQAKESEETGSTESLFGGFGTTVSSVEELTTNRVAATTVVTVNTSPTGVVGESAHTGHEGEESNLYEGDGTTPSLNSASTEAQQGIVPGTQASFSSGAAEGTSAVDESATVKVITTITRKEIVRPIESDASIPNATILETNRSTSVKTLPFSALNETEESSSAVPVAETPSETSVAASEDAVNADAVSSGPSLVITDFVQKTAGSSKEPATTPSV